jgi:cytochrome c5
MHQSLNILAIATFALFLTACGDKNQATPPASAPAAVTAPAPAPEAPAPVADNAVGKSAYNNTCALCHASGAAGAPKPSDKADWGPRIAQGKDTLYKHAIEGFNGAKGVMPARGGSTTLTDEQVKAAVDYMVSLAG